MSGSGLCPLNALDRVRKGLNRNFRDVGSGLLRVLGLLLENERLRLQRTVMFGKTCYVRKFEGFRTGYRVHNPKPRVIPKTKHPEQTTLWIKPFDTRAVQPATA